MHQTTQIVPYDLANVADLGDCPVNPANVDDALMRVETYFKKLVAKASGLFRRAATICVRFRFCAR